MAAPTAVLAREAPDAALDATRLLEWLETATDLSLRLAGRKGLSPADAEDFAGWVRLRLLDDDCAILRRFRGESSERTFLAAVVANLFRDHLDHERGKWRASAAARRGGILAIRLEAMLNRDGMSLASACEQLRASGFPALTNGEAARLAAGLPQRAPRRFDDDRPLAALPGPARADEQLWEAERSRAHDRARELLDAAMASLPELDRTLVDMRYRQELTVAEIARVLRVDQKPLYRRCEQALARLRRLLEASGLTADRLRESAT